MSVSGFHRSDLAETKFETRIPLFACRFRGPRLFLRQFACDVCAAMLCRVSGIVSGCVLNRVSCAGFCCVSRRTLKGWLVWGGRCGGGFRGADREVRGRTGNLFVSGPRTLPGGRPESDPELCFLTGKGRVRAGKSGFGLLREIAVKKRAFKVGLGPETHAP